MIDVLEDVINKMTTSNYSKILLINLLRVINIS